MDLDGIPLASSGQTLAWRLLYKFILEFEKLLHANSQAGNPRRTTAWADDIQSRIGSGSDSDSSDDDDIAERSPYKDGTSFEIANEIWRGSMIEMLTRGNQCSTESV